MWGIEDALKASKVYLINMEDSVSKLELGAKYEYADWCRKAYEELVNRRNPLSIDEARRVGLDATTQIAQIREVRLKSMSRTRSSTEYNTRACPYCMENTQCNDIEPYTRNYAHQCKSCNITFYSNDEQVDKFLPKRLGEEISTAFSTSSTRMRNGAEADVASRGTSKW